MPPRASGRARLGPPSCVDSGSARGPAKKLTATTGKVPALAGKAKSGPVARKPKRGATSDAGPVPGGIPPAAIVAGVAVLAVVVVIAAVALMK